MKVVVLEDGNALETYELNILDQKIIVTRWGEDDYDVYFDAYDSSVRGTFADVIEEILEEAREKWEVKNA